eukprot:CAMPEP_0175083222 /NCGR_PEP_ID=MMETSP0052_2-20121109/27233_1 /TAXON_ID=51329 ORGANISM="Polytomella parva, Strain SAG 63-3" /NCGR_SAMPLE_ID=MMETSP0052_2 /ASSEMBLY_ACC=CAM_ASM_000194 /LENGTH=66 /DNA_ID=CAMNT_0016354589 /DNA_START=29 /DNA_END=226 /DNA_ORIENTATION=+
MATGIDLGSDKAGSRGGADEAADPDLDALAMEIELSMGEVAASPATAVVKESKAGTDSDSGKTKPC